MEIMEQDQRAAALVDEQLRKVKALLLQHREACNVRGDVTFQLSYMASGELTGVTIERAPADMTPEFVPLAVRTILEAVVLPPAQQGGVMSFTDLGPDSASLAIVLNTEADARHRGALAIRAKRKERNIIIALTVAGVPLLILEIMLQIWPFAGLDR